MEREGLRLVRGPANRACNRCLGLGQRFLFVIGHYLARWSS